MNQRNSDRHGALRFAFSSDAFVTLSSSQSNHPVKTQEVQEHVVWRLALLAALCLITITITACDSPQTRQPITGFVKVDGQAVERGSITLLPDQGHRGPSTSSSIAGGKYQFTSENGPPPGSHRVIIGIEQPQTDSSPSCETSPPTAGPESSSIAKPGPANTSSWTIKSRELNSPAVSRTRWESTVFVPAFDSPEADQPLHFSFQNGTENVSDPR